MPVKISEILRKEGHPGYAIDVAALESLVVSLRGRVAELEAKQTWHLACSVFPDANFDVLVCWDTSNDYPVIGMLDGGEEGQWVDHNGDPFPVPPSHWMPLPDPINP